ncbi:UNVERIFIED_CONTAM: hypothetical protein Sradi_3183700 [Sesamum radiatum]|uniref:GAG-pre-integrase domain-containing protein n=1 Tax=Sesamum radiatum TaxID=300843 RepID=A0AAW2RF22_SESRA
MITNSASWVLDTGYGAHICNDLQVLERSRKLSRDEVVLKLGDGKAVVAEAVGIVHLVVNDQHDLIMTTQNKRKMDNQENPQIWHARLGHISQDRIKRLVYSKSLEIDDLDHLTVCESCLKGKMTKKPFVGQSTLASGLKSSDLKYLVAKLKPFGRTKVIRYDKAASYKYLGVWGSPTYVKRLVGDKLDSRSSLCRFVGYPKETVGYYFYDPSKQMVFVSRNAVFLKKGFPTDTRREELILEESSEATSQTETVTSSAPIVPTNDIPVLRRLTRVFQKPERYGFLRLTGQLDNDPKTYGEAMSDID